MYFCWGELFDKEIGHQGAVKKGGDLGGAIPYFDEFDLSSFREIK